MNPEEEKNLEEEKKPEEAPAAEEIPAEEEPAAGTPAEPAEAPEEPAKEKKTREGRSSKKAAAEAEALKAQVAEANDKYLRLAAEYDNYRRRSKTERDNIYADVRGDTIKRFLPVYDNLLRAVQSEPDESVRKGMEAILTQFRTILEGFGVTEIEAVGKKFDPAVHEALLHIDDERYGEGEIVLELEKGFKLGDKVIRYSRVQVAN